MAGREAGLKSSLSVVDGLTAVSFEPQGSDHVPPGKKQEETTRSACVTSIWGRWLAVRVGVPTLNELLLENGLNVFMVGESLTG